MKNPGLTFAVTLALVCTSAFVPTSASAEPGGRRPGDLVRIVKQVDPDTRTTGRVHALRGVVRAGGVEVAIAAHGDVVTIGDDTVIRGDRVDYVVRAVDRGFQAAAVISDPAQAIQTYRFRGNFLESSDDGTVIVRAGGRAGEPVAVIDPAWAVDARGARIASRFQVHGDTLTQVTDLSPSTKFPVVADPRVRWPWYGISVDFNRSETYTIGFVAGGCAVGANLIPYAPARIAFAVACGTMALMARAARENGKCLSVKFIAATGYGAVPWIAKCYA